MLISLARSALGRRLGILPRPKFVTFFVTWRCNSRCIFCDIWRKPSSKKDELDVRQIARIFRQLGRLDCLRLSGGEPFLRADLPEIINVLQKINRPEILHITSTGLLTDRIVETMRRIKRPNRVHLKLSIDDTGDKHDAVRGLPGAYSRVMKTIETLAPLRKKLGFHLGVNQAIVSEENAGAYRRLKKALAPYGVPIYPVIAHDSGNSLYSAVGTPPADDVSYRLYAPFSRGTLESLFDEFLRDSRKTNSFAESVVDRYYLRGLRNRLVRGKPSPNPRCVALRNHLRLLPNGDVPTCYFNSTVVGNLHRQTFAELWESAKVTKARKWVDRCPGCWESCEVIPSAAYTGDLWKGLL